MREQLIQYVDLLFAGAAGAEDVKQEILQNTLDRYDDLIAQGKSSQAAYSLAISGIGDVSELLGGSTPAGSPQPAPAVHFEPAHHSTPAWKKALRAVAIFLYIISIIPLIVLSELGMEIIGLCGTIAIVAVATGLIIIASSGKSPDKKEETENLTPWQELNKAINSISGIVTLCVYLAVSFTTGAWWISWLIFPICAAVKGLIKACIDLKEASKHEN